MIRVFKSGDTMPEVRDAVGDRGEESISVLIQHSCGNGIMIRGQPSEIFFFFLQNTGSRRKQALYELEIARVNPTEHRFSRTKVRNLHAKSGTSGVVSVTSKNVEYVCVKMTRRKE